MHAGSRQGVEFNDQLFLLVLGHHDVAASSPTINVNRCAVIEVTAAQDHAGLARVKYGELLPTALFATLLASLPHTPMVVSILEGIALLAEYTLRVLVAVARTLPSFQSAGVPHWGIIVLAALVAGAALMLRGTRARIAGCALTGALLALGPSRVVEPRAPRLVAFDVGQGDAVLVQGSL